MTVTWSCVLDDTPPIWTAFRIWTATLLHCAHVDPSDVVVHHVVPLRADCAALIERTGLRAIAIAPFDPRSPHCNKIRQCETDYGTAGKVVLTDVDLAFLKRPPTEELSSPVAGKPVDKPNPPLEILARVFEARGLPLPEDTVRATYRDESGQEHPFETLKGNFNGGVYVVDASLLAALGAAWAQEARWLLDRAVLPGRYAVHVDQVAFCLAIHDLGIEPETLSARWNLPSHMVTDAADPVPYIVHHHGRLEPDLRLSPLRPARHEAEIARANQAIAAFAGSPGPA